MIDWPRDRPTDLAMLRIALYGVWVVNLLLTDFSLYSRLPSVLFKGHGLSAHLPIDILAGTPHLLEALKWVAILGCLLCLLGVAGFRLIGLVTFVPLFLLDASMKALGTYANHAQMVPLLLALTLPLFPAADAYSLKVSNRADQPSGSYRLGLLYSAMLMTITYSFIGARRLMIGGVGIYRDGSLERWIVGRTLEDNAFGLEAGLSLLDHRWLVPILALGMFVVTIFEILSPLALRYVSFRRLWLLVIVAFHLSTLLGMNILFWESVVLLLVLFLPTLFPNPTRPANAAPYAPAGTG
jgi:hypothetical protein